EGSNLTLGLERDLAPQIAVRDGGYNGGDAAHLIGQIARHRIDVVGEVLPGPCDARDLGLTPELALCPHLPGDAGDLAGERIELVDHGVDRVLLLEDLTADVDRDLLGQIAPGHRRGHLGDVASPVSEVAGHRIDVVREVLPGACNPTDLRLTTKGALG